MARRVIKTGRNEVQIPLYHIVEKPWHPTPVSALPDWPEHGKVCIDVETRDDHLKKLGPGVRRGAYIAGFSFAIDGGPSFYVPVRHAGGDNIDNPEMAWLYLRNQAKRFKGILVGANLQYDLDYLAERGVAFTPEWFRDVQIADPLIDESHLSYSLDNIAQRWGFGGKLEEELRRAADDWGVNPKKELWKLPARHVAKYAIGDVTLPLAILKRQEREIDNQGLWKIYNLESQVLPILLEVRRRGVLIDQEQVARVERYAIAEAQKALDFVKHKTGCVVSFDNVTNASALIGVMSHMGITLAQNAKGKYLLDKQMLMAMKDPITDAIVRARGLNKLNNTFVASIRSHMTDGRIHCSFNQLKGSSSQDHELQDPDEEKGVRYGRLSSSNPNLQQQPSRDEWAQLWRSIYLPESGMLWASSDYSKQEPRVLTHYAELTKCRGAYEFAEKLRQDATTCPYKTLALATKTEYKATKIIYLGLSYSMGGAKLCKTLGLPTCWKPDRQGRMREMAGEEGAALFRMFHEGAPFIRQLNYKIQDAIQDRGYIRTLLGRKLHFPLKAFPSRNPVTGKDENYDWAHKGLNRLIQGSSADQTKQAVVNLHEAGIYVQLQVHDEVAASVTGQAQADQMGQIMRDAVKLTVPMNVDVETGASWGDSMGD